jgi:hypothetical protein
MWMNVTVRNYGDSPASGVTVQVQQDGDALPALALDDVPPGQELTHTFRVQFAGPGAHWLSGALGTDAVAIDNHRYFASLLPAARPVLIIEGSPNSRDGRQLALALAPGGNTPTGWQPHVEPSRFLVDEERLKRQAAVCLLDVPRLAEDELAALEKYVRDGGGVAVFVGAQTQRGYYNDRLYRNGEGLFPAPLRLPTQLLDRSGDSLPDVDVSDHVLFKILAGRRNSYLELLMVDYYYAVADDWSPAPDGDTRVIARLRNGAPLVIEKQLGRGRVVAQLTKVSAEDTPLGPWTNWSSNPVFPVLANELVNYLAAGSDSDELFNVGDNLVVAAAEAEYEPAVRIVLPREGPSPAELPLDAAPAAGMLVAELPAIAASGVYHALLQKREGGLDRRSYAFNVAAGEGDLELASRAEISRRLEGVDFQWHDSADMRIEDAQLAGLQLGDSLLGALIALLLGEQLLAYSASYHIRV